MNKKIWNEVMEYQVEQARYIIEALISRIMLQNANGDYPSYHITIPYGTSCDDEYDYSTRDEVVRSLCRALEEYSPIQVSTAMNRVIEVLHATGYSADMNIKDGSVKLTISEEGNHE